MIGLWNVQGGNRESKSAWRCHDGRLLAMHCAWSGGQCDLTVECSGREWRMKRGVEWGFEGGRGSWVTLCSMLTLLSLLFSVAFDLCQ